MKHGTTLLLGLEGVAVERVESAGGGARVVHVVTSDASAAACPACGVVSRSAKEYATTRPADVPYGEDPVLLRWHKRRWRCTEQLCARKTFTEAIDEVPPGARTTTRLRRSSAAAVAENRCVDEVARSHRVSWPVVQRAVDARAATWCAEPAPPRMLGIDETAFGRARWIRDPSTGRPARSEPFETGFVDLTGGQGLLGQVTGRTSAAVIGWLETRGQDWKDAVEVVAIDPSAPYRNAVRKALPHATIVLDHFHLVALANQVVTKVRQRVTREQLGRRGRKKDPTWANRRLLLRARERLSPRGFARMWNGCIDGDATDETLAAWIAKEQLRTLLACGARGGNRADIAHHLHRFYTWCADVEVDEIAALAETIDAWWPEIHAFLQLRVTNAPTEGTNRLVKNVKRHACGFRNHRHYRDRVRLHCIHNKTRMSARTGQLPAQR